MAIVAKDRGSNWAMAVKMKSQRTKLRSVLKYSVWFSDSTIVNKQQEARWEGEQVPGRKKKSWIYSDFTVSGLGSWNGKVAINWDRKTC